MKNDKRMKILSLTLSILLGTMWTSAQDMTDVYGKASAGRMDLSVPDAPAFSILDVQPSTILRPSSLREVSILVSRFLEEGSALPQALAVELSPALLIRGNQLRLSDYRKSAWLYRARVSVASVPSVDAGTDVSVGLRFTLIDRSDMRCDPKLLDQLYRIGREINDVQAEANRIYIGNPALFEDLPQAEQAKRREMAEAYVDSALGRRADDTILQARDEAKQRLWNAEILEFAFASKFHAADSTISALRASSHAVWVTWGLPLGSPGMILMGGRGMVRENAASSVDLFTVSGSLRAYYGTETFKGFLEASGSWASDLLPRFNANLGGELNLLNGLWLDATVGIESEGARGQFIRTAWNLRFATPEITGPAPSD